MHEKVKAFLDAKKAEERKHFEAYRQEVMMEAGLVERTYFEGERPEDDDTFYEKYPYWDEEQGKYYNASPIEVTDEEFAQIEEAMDSRMPEKVGGMFSNIGGKIQGVAKVVCWGGIIVSILAGIIMIMIDDHLALAGLLSAVVGSVGSWVSSLFLYGFGELIVKVTEIEKQGKKA